MVVLRALSSTGVHVNPQGDRSQPFPVLAADRQIVGLGIGDEAMFASSTNGQGVFAATDSQRTAPCVESHQFPAGGIGVAESREAMLGLEPREAWRLSSLDAAKEGLKRQIEPAQGLLQGVAAQFDQLGPGGFDLRQDVLLVVVGNRLAAFAVRLDAFLQGRVV